MLETGADIKSASSRPKGIVMLRSYRAPSALLMIACMSGAMTLACMSDGDMEPAPTDQGGPGGDGLADEGRDPPEESPEEPLAYDRRGLPLGPC